MKKIKETPFTSLRNKLSPFFNLISIVPQNNKALAAIIQEECIVCEIKLTDSIHRQKLVLIADG